MLRKKCTAPSRAHPRQRRGMTCRHNTTADSTSVLLCNLAKVLHSLFASCPNEHNEYRNQTTQWLTETKHNRRPIGQPCQQLLWGRDWSPCIGICHLQQFQQAPDRELPLRWQTPPLGPEQDSPKRPRVLEHSPHRHKN